MPNSALTMRISASPLEITDAQIQLARVGKGPETDTRSMEVRGNLRPGADAHNFFFILLPSIGDLLAFIYDSTKP